MSINLQDNNLQKFLVKIKAKFKTDQPDTNSFEVDKIYFLQIEVGINHDNRRINILNDSFVIMQYYYDKDGIMFNEHFEIVTSNTLGGALKKKRKTGGSILESLFGYKSNQNEPPTPGGGKRRTKKNKRRSSKK